MQPVNYPLRTSLLHLNLMRFATPHNQSSESEADFKADTAWFKAHPRRSQVIRAASFSEFDTFEVRQQCGAMKIPPPPTLWVLIQRSGTVNHIIIPIFMGEQCFPTDNSIQRYDAVEDDGALQLVLHHFNHNQGFDALNLLEWHQQWVAAKLAATKKNEAIH